MLYDLVSRSPGLLIAQRPIDSPTFLRFFEDVVQKKYCLISLYPLFPSLSYHLSLSPSFFWFMFLACTLHRSKSHAPLKLWWYIYQTHTPRSSVLHVFPLLYIIMYFTLLKIRTWMPDSAEEGRRKYVLLFSQSLLNSFPPHVQFCQTEMLF